MTHALLADTGPLYAAADPDDQYHAQAQKELADIRQDGFAVMVACPTLLDCYSLVLRRLGLHVAHTWLDQMQNGTTLVNPTPEDYLAGMTRVRSYADQPLTLYDTVLATLSARLKVPVWTYDHHFDLMRVDVWR
jgi:predicted nucleic acid-binding protein